MNVKKVKAENWTCYSLPELNEQTGQWEVEESEGLGDDKKVIDVHQFGSEKEGKSFVINKGLGL